MRKEPSPQTCEPRHAPIAPCLPPVVCVLRQRERTAQPLSQLPRRARALPRQLRYWIASIERFVPQQEQPEPEENTPIAVSGCLAELVGVRGFEPPTPASRTQYSTRLSYTPIPTAWGRKMLPKRFRHEISFRKNPRILVIPFNCKASQF